MLRKNMEVMLGALGGDATIFENFEVTDTWG
jgi:hypothetical protein